MNASMHPCVHAHKFILACMLDLPCHDLPDLTSVLHMLTCHASITGKNACLDEYVQICLHAHLHDKHATQVNLDYLTCMHVISACHIVTWTICHNLSTSLCHGMSSLTVMSWLAWHYALGVTTFMLLNVNYVLTFISSKIILHALS